jgi:hypothetical protein
LKKKKVPKTNMAATFDDATFVTRKITQPRYLLCPHSQNSFMAFFSSENAKIS